MKLQAVELRRIKLSLVAPFETSFGVQTERDVLGQIAAGFSNKQAGRELGISPRTIEVHRARIMEKLGARNAADLMRIVLSDGRA